MKALAVSLGLAFGAVASTALAPAPSGPEQAQAYLDAIAEHYEGDAELGTDLGRY